MGAYSDARLEAFREATGIRPLSGEAAKFVRDLQEKCIATALMLENELSGIRDGNGNWHGCDVVSATCEELSEAVERVWHGTPKGMEDVKFRVLDYEERIKRMGVKAGVLPEDA